jgi:hypothetical protein
LVGGLEREDGTDTCQVQPIIEEATDLSKPDEIVVAVATGTARAPKGDDQPTGFIEAKVLWSAPDQFGGDRYPVEAPGRVEMVAQAATRRHRRNSGKVVALDIVIRV